MKSLNKRIKKILAPGIPDYLGFADMANYRTELKQFGGRIVEGYRYGISIGIALPDSIVDHLPDRFDPNVACSYRTHAYSYVNDRLNAMASRLASMLNGSGYRTLPLPAAERTIEAEAVPTVSHKMIAHIAGLGWIGKNCLLVTPDRGPRVRFVSLLTDAPLKTVDKPCEQRCGNCTACRDICPVRAITGENYKNGEPRERRLDFLKCQDYFEKLKREQTWPVCGLYLYVCPYGRK